MPSTFLTRHASFSQGERPPLLVYYILPRSLSHPGWMFGFAVLPWFLLLAVNLWLFYPVWGEMSPDQFRHAAIFLGIGGAMGMASAAASIFRLLRREDLKWPEHGILVILASGYLWLSLDWCMGFTMVPESVSRWILPPENLMGLQFSLAAPALFFSLLHLACFETKSRFAAGPIAPVLGLVGGPLLIFMALSVFSAVTRFTYNWSLPHWLTDWIGYAVLISLVPLTLIALGCVLRLGAGLFLWTHNLSNLFKAWITGAFCLLMPLGGLLLNKEIPFPTDFQSPLIYVLTVINGAILTWPAPQNRTRRMIRWLAISICFPFSAYFFLIFLPWMPLTIPAMLMMGAGFLILAPIILFAVHLGELVQGWQEAQDRSQWITPTLAMLAAMTILPGYLLFESFQDRTALRQALDFAYRSPYGESPLPVDAARAAKTLKEMRDMQQGLYMPLLSETYKSIVFDGMVLQQQKIQKLYAMFSGQELPATSPGRYRGFYSQEAVVRESTMFNPFAEGHVVAHPVLSEVPDSSPGAWKTYSVDLGLRNESDRPGEFVGHMSIPEGVWVTGMELDLDGTMVPARIFEKKTALWVYEKIRDMEYRRDPALIFYNAPGSLELRVFPFQARQARAARLFLLAAPGSSPKIRLNDIDVPTPDVAQSGPQEASQITTPHGTMVQLPPDESGGIVRPWKLHFIIDRSIDGLSLVQTGDLIRGTIDQLGIKDFVFNQANFSPDSVTGQPSENGICFTSPGRGGFCFERAVKSLMAAESKANAESGQPGSATLYIAVTKKAENVLPDDPGKSWLGLAEDSPVYGIATPQGLSWRQWSDGKSASLPSPTKVTLVKAGSLMRAVATGKSTRFLEFPETSGTASQFVDGEWKPIPSASPVPDKIAKIIEATLAASSLDFFPEKENQLFPESVRLAREAGVLTTPTSFMIVENSAQWKMLERQEKKKTGAAKEFDFEDKPETTPEPATWALLLAGGVLCFGVVRFRKRMGRRPA